jgi:hypothetical protein
MDGARSPGASPLIDPGTCAPLCKYGPDFACGSNNKLPCAWGGVKVMLAFGSLPVERRTGLIEQAIERGVAFLFGKDPAQANYPSGWSSKPSSSWWKFGFPVFYVTDVLQIVEVLVLFGYAHDFRLGMPCSSSAASR